MICFGSNQNIYVIILIWLRVLQACRRQIQRKHFEHLAFYPLTICINRENERFLCFVFRIPSIYHLYIFLVARTKHIHHIICSQFICGVRFFRACSVCLTRVTRESFLKHIEECCSFLRACVRSSYLCLCSHVGLFVSTAQTQFAHKISVCLHYIDAQFDIIRSWHLNTFNVRFDFVFEQQHHVTIY